MQTGDLIDLEIQSIAFGGDGVARHNGCAVFVPFVMAGEKVRVRLTRVHKQYAKGEITEILIPSPERMTAPCAYFAQCAGCQYQHLPYSMELKLKETQVRETLQRLGGVANPPLLSILASPSEYAYRNRITVHAGKGKLGFHSQNPRELVDINRCLLAHEELNQELTQLRLKNPKEGHYSLRLSTLSQSGFAQANLFLNEAFSDLVTGHFSNAGETLIEGYAGAGFFTKKLATLFKKIIAIEQDPRLLKDAHRLELDNVQWTEGTVEAELAKSRITFPDASILLDPPRDGLPVTIVAELTQNPAPLLVYVSCNPSTLARDSRKLQEAYTLQSIQPVDLFPRTAQIECVSVWRRI